MFEVKLTKKESKMLGMLHQLGFSEKAKYVVMGEFYSNQKKTLGEVTAQYLKHISKREVMKDGRGCEDVV